MRRFIVTVGCLVLAVAPVPASEAASNAPGRASVAASQPAAPSGYTPKTGVKFNYPIGNEEQKRRIFRHIVRSVDSSPPKSTIRFAVFSFADKATADSLVRAHERGVHVKVISAGANPYPPFKRLQSVLGTDPNAKSFAIACERSCRGTAGEMHAKVFQFSRSGKAENVTMVGSNNLTRHNSHEQWSDLYTVAGDRGYFSTFRRWFTQLRLDQPMANPYMSKVVGGNEVAISPIDLDLHPDPLVTALDRVTCLTRAGDIDPEAPDPEAMVPTALLIATSAWNGPRGKRLAVKIGGMIEAGCTARVFYGEGTGPAVRSILANAGAELTAGTHPRILTHQKLLIVNGQVDGQLDTIRVLTGSQNWSTRSLARDDVIVRIADQTVGEAYVAGFWRMWRMG